jgi:hypothetical protein
MEDHNRRTAPHPPYSPDLAPSDFLLFGDGKRAFQAAEFENSDKLLDAGVQIVTDIPSMTEQAPSMYK